MPKKEAGKLEKKALDRAKEDMAVIVGNMENVDEIRKKVEAVETSTAVFSKANNFKMQNPSGWDTLKNAFIRAWKIIKASFGVKSTVNQPKIQRVEVTPSVFSPETQASSDGSAPVRQEIRNPRDLGNGQKPDVGGPSMVVSLPSMGRLTRLAKKTEELKKGAEKVEKGAKKVEKLNNGIKQESTTAKSKNSGMDLSRS